MHSYGWTSMQKSIPGSYMAMAFYIAAYSIFKAYWIEYWADIE